MAIAGTGTLPLAHPALPQRPSRTRSGEEEPAIRQPDRAEPEDFADFVATRGPGLVRLARGLLRDPYLAEDVVQDVLARALLRWSRVSAADDIDAYVRRMVVNACTSWFRRAVRRERSTDHDQLPERPVGDPTGDFAEREHLVALLRRLPARQRAVLVLRHYEGLPDAAIAELLGTSEVTVRSNAHRGLARLRELLAEERAAELAKGQWP